MIMLTVTTLEEIAMKSNLIALVNNLWKNSAPLTAVGLFMVAALAATAAGLVLDPRTITGAPAWMKPAKFAASIAIYTLTLAWVFGHLPAWRRTRAAVGWITAVVLIMELAIIDLQAWRGAASHFNVGTPLDTVLFSLMGAGIFLQTVTSIAVAVALWRQSFPDRALGLALRLGMTVTIVGAMTGGLMTAPTSGQLTDARATGRMLVAGAHTVGAPDGGPGLPGTGWSREHGDLRVPHFLGLHALQAFLLVVMALPRRWSESRRVRFVAVTASSYVALFAILLGQALGGQSVIAPDGTPFLLLAVWLVLSGVGWYIVGRGRPVGTGLASVANFSLHT
jgi:hypothetical protein